ncbi:hypothetical protein Tsubulata_012531 [Turnera subulata]|uniref:Transmembrane protein n=1 Tax=Turnera subulata TaxID=218843 RepID=A0A9Q0F5J8_9ROSI|nr:hypothetical protein Tsubulata_012531 [Turnera subulata]
MVSIPYIQMLSLQTQSLSFCSKQTISIPRGTQPCFVASKKPVPRLPFRFSNGDGLVFKGTKTSQASSPPCAVHAVENDSQQYEIDPDQAKEALEMLDQQLQELSRKKLNPPKIKASDVKLTREQGAEEEEVEEIPTSVLVYGAAALFLFTIAYNIFFITVIKPSYDGPY